MICTFTVSTFVVCLNSHWLHST